MIEYPELNEVQEACEHDWRPIEVASTYADRVGVRVMCPKCAVFATMYCARLRYSAEPSDGYGEEDVDAMPYLTVTLDHADWDALYTAIAGTPSEAVSHRLGAGIQQRAFEHLHEKISGKIVDPTRLRTLLRAEGNYSVRDEPEL